MSTTCSVATLLAPALFTVCTVTGPIAVPTGGLKRSVASSGVVNTLVSGTPPSSTCVVPKKPCPVSVTVPGWNDFTLVGDTVAICGWIAWIARQLSEPEKPVIWLRSLWLNVVCTFAQPPTPEHMM